HVTVNPSAVRLEGCALITLLSLVLIIAMPTLVGNEPIEPVWFPTVARQLLKAIMPKSASAETPPPDGASAIHSTDDRAALFILVLVLKTGPLFTDRETVNCFVLVLYETSAEITSFGMMGVFVFIVKY